MSSNSTFPLQGRKPKNNAIRTALAGAVIVSFTCLPVVIATGKVWPVHLAVIVLADQKHSLAVLTRFVGELKPDGRRTTSHWRPDPCHAS